MLKISLERLVRELEGKTGRPVTIAEISLGSGVHRNIISRIINKPDSNTSSNHLDKIIQFFFSQLRPFSSKSDEELISFIISSLFEFFPEGEEHRRFLDSLERLGDTRDIPTALLWEFYRLYRGASINTDIGPEQDWEDREEVRRRLKKEDDSEQEHSK